MRNSNALVPAKRCVAYSLAICVSLACFMAAETGGGPGGGGLMNRVLVAGATGDLGGFVAQEFKARGHFDH